ncbi:MAG: NifB/NifX family molybdenum-iron cluster-binding protein, partial [Bacteroidota bacterium]|nr:NifB/NifX family molybdenum-iron cluster-binding protein [Bacteroidota bacterium]
TKNNEVDSHFGHCDHFTIFSIDENKNIVNQEVFASPQGCGCKSNLAETFNHMGITIMLAGNMGEGAINKLSMAGIVVFRGCTGDIKQLVQNYLNGDITDSGISCAAHEHHSESGHQCSH